MADDTDFSLFVLSTCAFCQKPGADAPFDPDHPDWAWVHRLCAEQPGRLEAIAQGKCFFCLEAGRDMTPYGPGDPDDEVPWAHRSCIDKHDASLVRKFFRKQRGGERHA